MKYDVVIVGGGAAGSVVASRLAANARTSVPLLEAGPDYPDPAMLPDETKFGHTRFADAPEHNWALRGTITQEQGPIHVAQGKVIGGGSSINGQAIRQTVGSARHVSGTCKMGPDADPMAVVDQYRGVKGVQGLWVADASVMPRIPRSGGAHATVIMIGERVVDWIAAN
jgi:choline dehydrogenase-like flavoprotein